MADPSIVPGVRVMRVPDGPSGRVDRFVADATGLSRSYVQRLISDGRLTVSGEPLKANSIVGAGTERSCASSPPYEPPERIEQEDRKIGRIGEIEKLSNFRSSDLPVKKSHSSTWR